MLSSIWIVSTSVILRLARKKLDTSEIYIYVWRIVTCSGSVYQPNRVLRHYVARGKQVFAKRVWHIAKDLRIFLRYMSAHITVTLHYSCQDRVKRRCFFSSGKFYSATCDIKKINSVTGHFVCNFFFQLVN